MKTRNDEKLAAIKGIDRVYLQTLVGYLRSDFTKDPEAIEDVIADILDGVTIAIDSGQSAKRHFGNDPQTAADAILKELPHQRFTQYLGLAWPWVNLFAAFFFLQGLFRQPMRWRIDDFDGLLIVPAMLVGTWFFRGFDFNRLSRRTKQRMGMGCLSFVLIVGLGGVIISRGDNHIISMVWLLAGLVVLACGSLISLRHDRTAAWWLLAWGVMIATVLLGGQPLGHAASWALVLLNLGLFALAYTKNLLPQRGNIGG
ncbi:hypothetical protein [Lacticaseibacillus sp. GG6-2]